jgi:hypothetical protein
MHEDNVSRQRERGKREFVRVVKAALDRRRLAAGSRRVSGEDR